MGWHAAGFLVGQVTVEGVIGALPGGMRATGDQVSGDEALSMSWAGPLGIGRVGDWVVVSDPKLEVSFDADVCEALSRGRRLCAFVLHGVTNTYGFSWFVDGELVRRAVHADGAVAEAFGTLLAEEAGLRDIADEDYVWEVLGRLTGVTGRDLVRCSFTRLERV